MYTVRYNDGFTFSYGNWPYTLEIVKKIFFTDFRNFINRYIERFRKSEPKSREERMKEMQIRKQEFWWLQSDATQNKDTSFSCSDKVEGEVTFGSSNNLKSHSKQGMRVSWLRNGTK